MSKDRAAAATKTHLLPRLSPFQTGDWYHLKTEDVQQSGQRNKLSSVSARKSATTPTSRNNTKYIYLMDEKG